MRPSDAIPLRTFVSRTLALRLAAITLAIAVGVAALTYLGQRARNEREIADIAHTELALLLARAAQIGSERGVAMPAAIPTALAERRAIATERAAGRFVYARISALGAAPVEAGDAAYADRSKPRDAPSEAAATEMFHAGGKGLLRVRTPLPDSAAGQAELVFEISPAAAARARATLLSAMAIAVGTVLATVAVLYPVILRLVRTLANFSDDLLEANVATLSMLGAAIALRDSDTDAHTYRVTMYSLRLGEGLGLPPEQMRALLKGAFLHDVGKIGIRDDVLLKPGRLTDEEMSVMRRHVDHGVELVRRSAWLTDAHEVIGGHHEKVDGSGYPKGALGADIPITARIFAIVDVFDALTSKRPYKPALSLEAAIGILEQGRQRHFDSELLDAFLRIAPQLYHDYGAREDDGVKRDLERAARRHFRSGLDTLAY